MTSIDLRSPHWRFAVANYIHTTCGASVDAAVPELAQDLPGRLPWRIEARIHAGVLVVAWTETTANRIDVAGEFDEGRFQKVWSAISTARSYSELSVVPELQPEFSWRSLLLVVDPICDGVPLEHLDASLMAWLNDRPLAHAEEINRRRVERALPAPPRYDLDAIRNACWVVESPSAMAQGTAFQLDGVGFVTCAHVVLDGEGRRHPDLITYRTDRPTEKLTIRDIAASAPLDLAVFQVPAEKGGGLTMSEVEDVPLNAHIAVCGFPNHRPGDTCSLSPGVVTAHRMKSGVRRLLTNAGIVAGMSGGPAVGRGGEVVGVCANGAEYIQDARDTEDQSIIPIGALKLLDISSLGACEKRENQDATAGDVRSVSGEFTSVDRPPRI